MNNSRHANEAVALHRVLATVALRIVVVVHIARVLVTRRAMRTHAMIGFHRHDHTAAIADETAGHPRNLRSKQRKHCKQHSEA